MFAAPLIPMLSAYAAPIMAGMSVVQGIQGYQAAKADAAVASANAVTARQQANAREELVRAENRRRLGVQRAAAAQSGFDPNAGSLLDLQGDSAAAAELDALTVRYDGGLQSLSFENEAAASRRRGRNALSTGLMNAAGTLLAGAARDYGRYGPGFSGTQRPAPVADLSTRLSGGWGYN